VPEPTNCPPQLPAYQSIVSPEPTVADKVDEPPAQIKTGFADTLVGMPGGTQISAVITVPAADMSVTENAVDAPE